MWESYLEVWNLRVATKTHLVVSGFIPILKVSLGFDFQVYFVTKSISFAVTGRDVAAKYL